MKKLINSWGGNVCSAMYIASHGSKGSFILNDGIRSYGWLDGLLDRLGCKITVVMDACYSGSAIPHLNQPGREVYVACEADELSTGEYDRRFAEALDIAEADVDGDGVVEMWEADRWGKIEITHFSNPISPVKRYFDPEGDDDYDGLNNAFENNLKIDNYKHWKEVGIPKSEAPDPDVKDVYIEVDWMKDSLPYNFGTYSCLTTPDSYQLEGITALAFLGLLIVCIVAMLLIPVIAIIAALLAAILFVIICGINWLVSGDSGTYQELYKEHNINLHIDDGTGPWTKIGGGSEVRGHDKLLASSVNRKNGEYNDIYDYLEDEFAENRRGIFHYALCCEKIDPEDKNWIGGKAQCYTDPGFGVDGYKDGGSGEGWFAIDLDGPKGEEFSTAELARNFFHEMGHAVGALHDKILSYDYISSMNDKSWREGKTSLKYDFLKQYVGYNEDDYPQYNAPNDRWIDAENEWILLYHNSKNTLLPWW